MMYKVCPVMACLGTKLLSDSKASLYEAKEAVYKHT